MTGMVDSFEGDYAIIEMDGQTQDVRRDLLEDCVQVGDVVKLNGTIWVTDKQATEARKRSMKQLMDEVWDD